ncbi:MAG TPA: hypothetical protein VK498_14765 [Ferruginibacter sp.]|nr:hypothetical protein [Ferruginibacter sp.]
MRIIKILFITLFFFCGHKGIAQKKPTKVTSYPVRFKAPKLQTYLSSYKDSVSITGGEAESIIAFPLKVVDAKNTAYKISSYQFMYKKKAVTEDEKSGKVSGTTSISADYFKTTPLPGLWVNIIREQLKKGEQLYFFDVIVKDAQGRLLIAPNLKIMVQ